MTVYLMHFSIINNNIQCIGGMFHTSYHTALTLQWLMRTSVSRRNGLAGWLGDIILNIMHVHDVDRAWTVHNTRHACDVVCDILTCYSTSAF